MNKKKLTILLAVFVLLIIGMLALSKATKPETTPIASGDCFEFTLTVGY